MLTRAGRQWLRTVAWPQLSREQRVLVIHNLGDAPAANVALDLAAGPLCGAAQPRVLFATPGVPVTALVAPAVTATGGLDHYVPLAELPAHSSLVLDLGR